MGEQSRRVLIVTTVPESLGFFTGQVRYLRVRSSRLSASLGFRNPHGQS
jgi:hypothetical protein